MGTANLFHKKKARQAESHRREKARRDPIPRVLIVCEGTKTEPNYFKGLRSAFGLNPMNIVIADKKHGLDPKGLVEYAVEEYKKDHDFNDVFCVFDRDKHTTYNAALDKISAFRMKKGTKLHPITSIPCFEIWLLLHFTYVFLIHLLRLGIANLSKPLRLKGMLPTVQNVEHRFLVIKRI